MQPRIAVISGIRLGDVFSLAQGDFVIGRDAAADLHLTDEFVAGSESFYKCHFSDMETRLDEDGSYQACPYAASWLFRDCSIFTPMWDARRKAEMRA